MSFKQVFGACVLLILVIAAGGIGYEHFAKADQPEHVWDVKETEPPIRINKQTGQSFALACPGAIRSCEWIEIPVVYLGDSAQ